MFCITAQYFVFHIALACMAAFLIASTRSPSKLSSIVFLKWSNKFQNVFFQMETFYLSAYTGIKLPV